MADHEHETVIDVAGGIVYRRRGLSDEQIAGRACLQCGQTDEYLRPFGTIGDHRGALHERCRAEFRGEYRGRR